MYTDFITYDCNVYIFNDISLSSNIKNTSIFGMLTKNYKDKHILRNPCYKEENQPSYILSDFTLFINL